MGRHARSETLADGRGGPNLSNKSEIRKRKLAVRRNLGSTTLYLFS